jgi:hypothetical protein
MGVDTEVHWRVSYSDYRDPLHENGSTTTERAPKVWFYTYQADDDTALA